jgi:hypothetical protein
MSCRMMRIESTVGAVLAVITSLMVMPSCSTARTRNSSGEMVIVSTDGCFAQRVEAVERAAMGRP